MKVLPWLAPFDAGANVVLQFGLTTNDTIITTETMIHHLRVLLPRTLVGPIRKCLYGNVILKDVHFVVALCAFSF